ncbi:hypothetical protein STENM36S_03339 [Streptomyces tendae]
MSQAGAAHCPVPPVGLGLGPGDAVPVGVGVGVCVPGSTAVVPRARSPARAYALPPIVTVQFDGVDTGR